VTAGWQEREADDTELRQLLGGPVVNLSLHSRWLRILEQDAEFAVAERAHEAVLTELRQLYLIQAGPRPEGNVRNRADEGGPTGLREGALTDAVQTYGDSDERHLERIREAQHAFFAAWRPQERPAVSAQRDEVRQLLASAQALVIAGGHVDELVKVLHPVPCRAAPPATVIAWSAGAMALTDRVVIFHDHVPHGVAQTEVFAEGLGLIRDLVLLPHARRRLRVEDPMRMSVLARRFAPSQCLVLDDGLRVDLTPDGRLPPAARIVAADGRIASVQAA
jgi:hypothetical protein